MFGEASVGEGFGELIGASGWEVGGRLVLTALVLLGALLVRRVAVRAVRRRFGTEGVGGGGGPSEAGRDDRRSAYWLRKVSTYAVWAMAGLLIVLVWAELGRRAGFVVGAFSAGVAFALQNVFGSFAAWLSILSGKTLRVGDRVKMGGVRGDVIDLSPLRTTVMEIGEPGGEEGSDIWVRARQYTGRIVTISNKAFFDEPIYNYSKDFDFVWEEISLPLKYDTNWERGREILLEEARAATGRFLEGGAEALAQMARRYLVPAGEVAPRAFLLPTDNWIELTVRFVVPVRSARGVKSAISEKVLRRYARENIAIASATSEIVGFPPLKIEGLEDLRGLLEGSRGQGAQKADGNEDSPKRGRG